MLEEGKVKISNVSEVQEHTGKFLYTTQKGFAVLLKSRLYERSCDFLNTLHVFEEACRTENTSQKSKKLPIYVSFFFFNFICIVRSNGCYRGTIIWQWWFLVGIHSEKKNGDEFFFAVRNKEQWSNKETAISSALLTYVNI